MKILGIDTATKNLTLGIYDNGKIYEYHLEVGRKLSVLLSVTIKRVLEALELRLNDIDYFACGIGPGSFTGMRVGVSTIKGLCLGLNKPVIGISTLDILAKSVKPGLSPIAAIVDAKRNLIYCGIYRNKNGVLKRVKPYMLLNEAAFFEKALPSSILLGDAISLYREKLIRNIKGVTLLDKDCWYPKAHNIIALALERIEDEKLNSAFHIEPIYLYPKECQIRKASV